MCSDWEQFCTSLKTTGGSVMLFMIMDKTRASVCQGGMCKQGVGVVRDKDEERNLEDA
jgi:hypothetical protein